MTESGPFEGASLDSVKRMQARFEANVQRWEVGNVPFNELVTPAFGYWIGYPLFLEQIGFEWRGDPVRFAAYSALNHAHLAATHFLMETAERLRLDSTPLWESSQLCQRLFAREGWKHFDGRTWPECVERTISTLPADERETIRKGHALCVRLSIKIGIDLENLDIAAGWLSPRDVATKYGLNAENLRGRLRRWRKQNGEGWMEVPSSERKSREPQFLYRLNAIQVVVNSMLGR